MRLSLRFLIFLGCGALFLGAGCRRPQAPAEESRLSGLAIYYGRYISQHKGQAPASEKELKDFIRKIDTAVNLDELFLSPRDNELYVVRYLSDKASPAKADKAPPGMPLGTALPGTTRPGTTLPGTAPSGTAPPGQTLVTVHEKNGVGGKKMIGLSTGQVQIVDEEELAALKSASR